MKNIFKAINENKAIFVLLFFLYAVIQLFLLDKIDKFIYKVFFKKLKMRYKTALSFSIADNISKKIASLVLFFVMVLIMLFF